MAAPSVLFGSCTQTHPRELVKGIVSEEQFANSIPVIEDIEAYKWHVDTKYYTADIHLCTTGSKTIGDRSFADSVQAVILHFNSDQLSTFDLVKTWLPFIKEIEPAVKIVVCERCTDNSEVSRPAVHKWCLENGFELVELDPLVDSEDEEDDFAETTGIKRIIQALHAHTWPNLVMKENPNITSPYFRQLMAEAAEELNSNSAGTAANKSEQSEKDGTDAARGTESADQDNKNVSTDSKSASSDNSKCLTKDSKNKANDSKNAAGSESASGGTASGAAKNKDATKQAGKDKKKSDKNAANQGASSLAAGSLLSEDMALLEALGNDDPEDESFEHMFERLKVMKDKASSLPPEQRRHYAEQVAISFWKAIGGDEEEIDRLSDSD